MNKKKNTKTQYLIGAAIAVVAIAIFSFVRYKSDKATAVQSGDIVDVYYTIQDQAHNTIQTNS